MDLKVDVYFTLALAAALLVLGARIVGKVPFLSRYSIPEAVVGGLLAAFALTAARGVNFRVQFDTALQTPFNIMFFTTVGLAADVRSVIKGGRMLALYFASVLGVLVLQNVIGGALAYAFGIHPVNGLIAGSITLVGGHSTGAAWSEVFVKEYQLKGALELAIACATYGLVAGGLLGGPFTRWLIQRHNLAGSGIAVTEERAAATPVRPEIPVQTLVNTLLLIFLSMAIGLAIHRWYGSVPRTITVPAFIWALAWGAILRNLLSLTRVYEVDDRAVELLGSLALSLFLSIAIMSLKLWELVGLAIPMIVILAVQTAAMLAYTAMVTFPMMGRNYDAALLSTGQIGFGLGSTATAIAGMKSVAARYGYSPLAFLLVPVMGAFLIDLANMAVIKGFLMLPGFRP